MIRFIQAQALVLIVDSLLGTHYVPFLLLCIHSQLASRSLSLGSLLNKLREKSSEIQKFLRIWSPPNQEKVPSYALSPLLHFLGFVVSLRNAFLDARSRSLSLYDKSFIQLAELTYG